MKLLLIGAGYVGMALLNVLKNQPHEIYITTTTSSRVEILKGYGKEVLDLNVICDESFAESINQCDGAIILVAPSNLKNYEETYLDTAKRVCFSLKDRKTPFYILYTSSSSVYEGLQSEWVTEEMDLNPDSINAKILLETEKYYLKSSDSICILRLAGIYGPKREWNDRARKFSGKEMSGNGDEPTNHIHLDDILAAIIFCLENQITGIYNLANDEHPTRKYLYSNLCNQMEIPLPVWNEVLSTTSAGYKVSNKKIKQAGFLFY